MRKWILQDKFQPTGYIFPLTRSFFSRISLRYSPLKGTILGSGLQPEFSDNRSEYKPPQVITYFD